MKTKEEFWVEEAEFTGGHPENIKFEESSFNKFGEHGSNFDEVEKFATGKVKKVKPTKKKLQTEWESGKAEADADRSHWVDDRAPEADDFASGGRVPMIFGGSPGLKAMYQSVLKNLSKSQKKKISSFFPKMSAAEKQLIKLGETVDPRAFHALNTREMTLKLEGVEHLISRLKQDKQMMEQVAANKAMKDEGLDFLMKHMEETDMIPKYLHKYTDIDKDILTLETIKKNLIMKDRKLNATGGLAGMLGE